MLKKAAATFGVVFVVLGVGGFLPFLVSTDSMGMDLLLGVFMVGTLHNFIHLGSGIAALISSKSELYARRYFQIFAVVYGLVMILGFIQGDKVLGILPVNMADNFLHLVITVSSAYFGFVAKTDRTITD